MSFRSLSVTSPLIFYLLAAPRVRAADGFQQLTWDPAWRPFETVDYVVTAGAGAASLLVFFRMQPRAVPRWTGGILFDDGARDLLRARSSQALGRVRTASDVTALSVVALLAVDSIVVPLARRSSSVAVQLTLMDGEAIALSSLVTTTMFKTIGRARPNYADCQRDPRSDSLCSSAPTTSFPSGHAGSAFTAAGLSCAHHAYLPLYGGRLADGLACAGAVTLATSVALLRVAGDRHYASDVLVGGAIGFGFGFGVPTLLHYGGRRAVSSTRVAMGPNLVVVAGTF